MVVREVDGPATEETGKRFRGQGLTPTQIRRDSAEPSKNAAGQDLLFWLKLNVRIFVCKGW